MGLALPTAAKHIHLPAEQQPPTRDIHTAARARINPDNHAKQDATPPRSTASHHSPPRPRTRPCSTLSIPTRFMPSPAVGFLQALHFPMRVLLVLPSAADATALLSHFSSDYSRSCLRTSFDCACVSLPMLKSHTYQSLQSLVSTPVTLSQRFQPKLANSSMQSLLPDDDSREDAQSSTNSRAAGRAPSHTVAACLSACSLASLLACLSACLPLCLLASLLACLSACLSVCLSACLPTCLPACLLSAWTCIWIWTWTWDDVMGDLRWAHRWRSC
jgi:hypothetical protein